MILKICTKCKQEKPLTEFYKYYTRDRYGPYYLSKCAKCRYKYYHRQNLENKRNWDYQTKYGITLAQYELILKSQNGVCVICQQPETVKDKNGKIKPSAIDNNHVTCKIRGLLCSACNHMLGKARDDPKILERAAKYLRQHNGQ